MPAAALANANADCQGKVWKTSFEWLAQYGMKGIKGRWTRAMAGTGICPICLCDELPCHISTQCPLLADLNLKLIPCPPAGGTPAPGPAPSPAPAPTLGEHVAAADYSFTLGLLDSSMAPSGLTAALAPAPSSAGNYELNEDFYWDGDNLGVDYSPLPKLNRRIAPYSPSCFHISFIPSVPALALSMHNSRPGSLVFLPLFNIFSGSSLSHQLFFLSTTVASLSLTLGPLTTWSLTSLASSAKSPSWVCQFEWETTHMFQSWVAIWPYLPSMANVSWSATYCMSQVWQFCSTAFVPTSPSKPVD
jgi:hypothetical protein